MSQCRLVREHRLEDAGESVFVAFRFVAFHFVAFRSVGVRGTEVDMRDPSVLLKYAEECVQRSWEVTDSEQRRTLKETAEFWRELAREVIRMNEFAESNVQASRSFRAANGLAAAEGS
jgi:hypothetical protein